MIGPRVGAAVGQGRPGAVGRVADRRAGFDRGDRQRERGVVEPAVLREDGVLDDPEVASPVIQVPGEGVTINVSATAPLARSAVSSACTR